MKKNKKNRKKSIQKKVKKKSGGERERGKEGKFHLIKQIYIQAGERKLSCTSKFTCEIGESGVLSSRT